jgi:hypothetical protein
MSDQPRKDDSGVHPLGFEHSLPNQARTVDDKARPHGRVVPASADSSVRPFGVEYVVTYEAGEADHKARPHGRVVPNVDQTVRPFGPDLLLHNR